MFVISKEKCFPVENWGSLNWVSFEVVLTDTCTHMLTEAHTHAHTHIHVVSSGPGRCVFLKWFQLCATLLSSPAEFMLIGGLDEGGGGGSGGMGGGLRWEGRGWD